MNFLFFKSFIILDEGIYMKNLAIFILFIFITSTCCFSAPVDDQKGKTIIYDVTYNVNLRNKLENDFDKKYCVEYDDHWECNYPDDAYYREVLEPYAKMKKPDLYKIERYE